MRRSSTPPAERESAAVVVAHPDDEALWLSSVLASAERVVYCFGEPFAKPAIASARRRVLAALPLPGVTDLGIPESGARFSADWAEPVLTATGIEVLDPAARVRYAANYPRLTAALRPVLAGHRHVYTHNPWGEYGHTEHVQVHRAVAALQAELGFTLWFSNYVGPASWPLAQALAAALRWGERRVLATDRPLARRLRRLYRRHGVWTWSIAHRWPAQETLYALPPAADAAPRHAFHGEALLDVARLRWWPMPWRSPQRALR